MIEKYFKKPETWDRIRACWLFEPIQRYVVWLDSNGYAARNVRGRVPLLMRFAEFAQKRGAKSPGSLPRHVQPFVEEWLQERRKTIMDGGRLRRTAVEVRGPIEQMLRVVLPKFVGRDRTRPIPFLEQAPGFIRHLRQERGLAAPTVEEYTIHLRSFEAYLQRIGAPELAGLSPAILSAFVTERGQTACKGTMHGVCSAVRILLRYAHREKLTTRDLSRSVEGPRTYRLSALPRSIPWAEVQRMLEAVDRRSTVGKRDYAILLLLATYGLRSREVAALTLDDLDWEHERLRVPERKAGHSTAYPLSPVVAEAIIDYLKNGRPKTGERRVFLCAVAPFRPCDYPCVSMRASHYLHKAGITVPRSGSHTLRHTCVQRLVDARFSLKSIGDYIGHASPESTKVYAKLDVEALRELAMGQGEEVL
jgi:integrase/recombinase XerD